MITRAEAVALTELLRTIRPAWDALTTINIICSLAGHDLADIAYAAVRTAQDTAMRTPASLAFTDSEHWRPTVRETADRGTNTIAERKAEAARCQHCDENGRQSNGFLCAHEDPAERERRVRARVAEARANIRPTIDRSPA